MILEFLVNPTGVTYLQHFLRSSKTSSRNLMGKLVGKTVLVFLGQHCQLKTENMKKIRRGSPSDWWDFMDTSQDGNVTSPDSCSRGCCLRICVDVIKFFC